MKKLLLSMGVLCSCFILSAQVVINEISYNPPESGTDSLEYIELFNAGDAAVDLSGYTMGGVTYQFEEGTMLNPGGFILLCESASAMQNVLGITGVLVWDGALSNGGEDVSLSDADGNIVDMVDFDDEAPWPTSEDGTDNEGASIELCDPLSDNALGSSWRAATNDLGVMINGKTMYGTPGMPNTVSCAVEPDHTVTTEGLDFIPADITIQQGQTIRWSNPSGVHNVNGSQDVYPNNPEGFYSGAATAGPWTFDHTFNIPGVYTYQCDPHLNLGMVGTVTVEAEQVDLAPLVISEIFYNDPLADDIIEFVEITNTGEAALNLENYTMSSGVTLTFPAYMLDGGSRVVIAANSAEMMSRFGIETIQWTDGGLSNSGETLAISDPMGNVVDEVTYDDSGDWSEQADGLGASLILCDLSSDNSMASSWSISTQSAGFELEGTAIFANPGGVDYCANTIEEVTMTNDNGEVTFMGNARLLGVVYGVNLRPNGLQFTLIDNAGHGISVFSASDNFGYTVNEGDQVYVDGSIGQYNGLAQIYASNVTVVSSDNPLMDATVVTTLDESTESQLVTLENVMLVDIAEWGGAGSGFNVNLTDGTNMYNLRIDGDVDLFSMAAPTGTFNVTGIGSQFDNSSPYDSGYQLLPRYVADISPYVPFQVAFPMYDIPTVTTVDDQGVADSLNVSCTLSGVVHSLNFRPSGLHFWIIDENNNGISVFSGSNNFGYTVTEGDELEIEGEIGQYRGLTQMEPSKITVLSTGNDLIQPELKEGVPLSEDDESKLVYYEILTFDQPLVGDGSSYSITGMDNDGNQIQVYFDADSELATSMFDIIGTGVMVRGIVSQFDQEEPYDSGYSIWVRYLDDFAVVSNTIEVDQSDLISISPNPAITHVTLDTDLIIDRILVSNLEGRTVISQENTNSNQLDISALHSGVYIIQVLSQGNTYTHRLIKI